MRLRSGPIALVFVMGVLGSAALANGCAQSQVGVGGGATITLATGSGGSPQTGTSSGGGGGGVIILPDAGPDAADAASDAPHDADVCQKGCGPVELCDPAHLGFDDNCDGNVDEGCACVPGSVHWCFKGDPTKRNVPGCFDGVETCTELGTWGDCLGGVHDIPDHCAMNDMSACHAITAHPYTPVHLKPGTGTFSANAVTGSEVFTVECPQGVSQCPAVLKPDTFKALQSGQYTVTYSKQVAGNPNPVSCTYPLFVAASGLRVELTWEHTAADHGVDLDLHVHQPVSTDPWGPYIPVAQDCAFNNCTFDQIADGGASPHWFPDTNVAPQPVNWDLDAITENNTCYGDPWGVGAKWQSNGQGCHNPRLDVDNQQCDYSVSDPEDTAFCAPENVNIDYPPQNQWLRIGVYYYYNHGMPYDVHPEVKIYCDGALAADLGPHGFYDPESPVTFESPDGAELGTNNRFWIVADVAFTNLCGQSACVVQPIYAYAPGKTPLLTVEPVVKSTFSPAWPPPPQ